MTGGGTKIMDSEKWSSCPSPSQGCPGKLSAPGARGDSHHNESKERLAGLPYRLKGVTALGYETLVCRGGVFWDCT